MEEKSWGQFEVFMTMDLSLTLGTQPHIVRNRSDRVVADDAADSHHGDDERNRSVTLFGISFGD